MIPDIFSSDIAQSELNETYLSGVKGWRKEDIEKDFKRLSSSEGFINKSIHSFIVRNSGQTRKRMLYDITRKVLGKDTENYAQKTGDCTSFGGKNAVEYLQAFQMLTDKNWKFRNVFPPYIYGIARTRTGFSLCFLPGSTGAAVAEAVLNYGVLFSDDEGVPSYSGMTARTWGCRWFFKTRKFENVAKTRLVKGVIQIKSWAELETAINNGYPCTIASNQGFSMSPGSDGYHKATGSWAHQMCVIGIGNYKGEDYVIILNSWGDVMGRLKDFDDPSVELPVGCIRARRSEIERSMIERGEVYAFSQLGDFKDNTIEINRELFKPF